MTPHLRRADRRARSDVMHRSPMGERRGWKFLGINVGAPAVPKGVFKATGPMASNPAIQQAIDEGANAVNQNIAAGNKRSAAGMLAVGGLGAAGALGAAGGAGGLQGPTSDTPFSGNMNPGDVSMEGDPTDPTSTAMDPYSEFPGGQTPGDTSDGGFGGWLKGQAQKAFGTGGPGQSSLFDKLLLGGSVAASAADQAYKRGLINKGVDAANNAYNAAAPLRTQGMASMQNRSLPDLSGIFTDPGNPYARSATPVKLTGGMSSSPSPS